MYIDQNVYHLYASTKKEQVAVALAFSEQLAKALQTEQADYSFIDFKYWFPRGNGSAKADWTRLRAELFQKEGGTPWLLITESPKAAHRWRGHSLA